MGLKLDIALFSEFEPCRIFYEIQGETVTYKDYAIIDYEKGFMCQEEYVVGNLKNALDIFSSQTA
ncbi:MAG: hypothetical protein ACK5LC_08465 [Coprobacillaceae bacterium]